MSNFSIIIPTFNDEKIIKKKVLLLIKKLKQFSIKYEIIIVNDGSIDKTELFVKDLLKKYKINLINNKINQGKSFSIIRGIKKSRYEYVILIDSDLPYFLQLNKVIKLLKKKNDFVFVDRRHKKSKVINNKFNSYKIIRFLIGFFISQILKIFINLENKSIDTQAGLKGFKKMKILKSYKFISKRFFLDIELIYLYKKYSKKIISIPVKYSISDKSSINIFSFKKNLEIFIELIKVIINIILAKKQF